jgi:hypothetical protein
VRPGKPGDAKTPGTTVANVAHQAYFTDVATKVVLPMFNARNRPFVLVFWLRDPNGSRHNARPISPSWMLGLTSCAANRVSELFRPPAKRVKCKLFVPQTWP